jgi:hypothetical protein
MKIRLCSSIDDNIPKCSYRQISLEVPICISTYLNNNDHYYCKYQKIVDINISESIHNLDKGNKIDVFA